MSQSDAFENDQLKLTYNATPIDGIADNAASSPLTNLYVALHTANPGESGNQSTSECNYTGYSRVAVARTSSGWTVTGNSVSPANPVTFGAKTGGSDQTVTHFSVGTDPTGTGKILDYGTISPSISVVNGVMPQLTTATVITRD